MHTPLIFIKTYKTSFNIKFCSNFASFGFTKNAQLSRSNEYKSSDFRLGVTANDVEFARSHLPLNTRESKKGGNPCWFPVTREQNTFRMTKKCQTYYFFLILKINPRPGTCVPELPGRNFRPGDPEKSDPCPRPFDLEFLENWDLDKFGPFVAYYVWAV